MPTLGHHPQHLQIPVLAQTNRTRRVHITPTISSRLFTELELRVRVYNGLVKPDDEVLIVIIFRDENNPGEDDPIGVGGGGWGGVRREGAWRRSGRAAADVGSEEDSGEEDEDAESDGDGIAKA